MLRIRFGKLAIAVLAVSGAAAHADAEGFFSKFQGSKVGGETMLAPAVHEGRALVPAFKVPFADANIHGFKFETPVVAQLGPAKISAKIGIGSFYAPGLLNKLEADKAAANATKAAISTTEPESSTSTIVPDGAKVRSSKETKGTLMDLTLNATWNYSSSLYGSIGGGVGAVLPTEKLSNFYSGVVGRATLIGYNRGAFSGELGYKGAIPFNKIVNPVSGLTFGVSYTL